MSPCTVEMVCRNEAVVSIEAWMRARCAAPTGSSDGALMRAPLEASRVAASWRASAPATFLATVSIVMLSLTRILFELRNESSHELVDRLEKLRGCLVGPLVTRQIHHFLVQRNTARRVAHRLGLGFHRVAGLGVTCRARLATADLADDVRIGFGDGARCPRRHGLRCELPKKQRIVRATGQRSVAARGRELFGVTDHARVEPERRRRTKRRAAHR